MGGVAEGYTGEANRHAELGEEHPGAAAAEKQCQSRDIDCIDDRCPEELERVGEGDIAQ